MPDPSDRQTETESRASRLGRAATAILAPLGGPSVFARFIGVSSVNAGTDFGLFNLILATLPGTDPPVVLAANAVSFTVAASVGYVLNVNYTFKVQHRWAAYARYMLVAASGLLVYSLALLLFLSVTPSGSLFYINVSKVLALPFPVITNLVGYRRFALKSSPARENIAPRAQCVIGGSSDL